MLYLLMRYLMKEGILRWRKALRMIFEDDFMKPLALAQEDIKKLQGIPVAAGKIKAL